MTIERRRAAGVALAVLLAGLLTATAGAQETDAPRTGDAVHTKADAEGFVVRSGDGAFRLRLGGYAQLDGRFYLDDSAQAAADTWVLRRVRPIVQGTVAKYFDFYINPDFGGGTTVLQDAYLDVHTTPKLRVRSGKFKTPFGLERLYSGSALLFVERALPTAIALNRDLGVQVHGELAGGVLLYQAGIFNGVVDGGSADGDTNDGKDLAGRVFLQPFKRGGTKALARLGLGIAATRGEQSGALPSYRSGGQLTFFSYASGVTADGTHTRVSPQTQWSHGPVGLFGEYARSSQDARRGNDVVRVSNHAWQAAVAVVLTGEAASPGGVKPGRPFDPAKGQWGALELAARWSTLTIDADAFARGLADPSRSAREARAWGLGLNWYLDRNVRQSLSYERTTFEGGAAAGGDRRAENAFFIRSQISF
jgi:phosphate-selective porin OprO/OprP